jgi:hypothetical protein
MSFDSKSLISSQEHPSATSLQTSKMTKGFFSRPKHTIVITGLSFTLVASSAMVTGVIDVEAATKRKAKVANVVPTILKSIGADSNGLGPKNQSPAKSKTTNAKPSSTTTIISRTPEQQASFASASRQALIIKDLDFTTPPPFEKDTTGILNDKSSEGITCIHGFAKISSKTGKVYTITNPLASIYDSERGVMLDLRLFNYYTEESSKAASNFGNWATPGVDIGYSTFDTNSGDRISLFYPDGSPILSQKSVNKTNTVGGCLLEGGTDHQTIRIETGSFLSDGIKATFTPSEYYRTTGSPKSQPKIQLVVNSISAG